MNIINEMSGKWVSESAEDMGNGTFCTREFKFNNSEWQILFTLYLDRDLKMPVFTFRGLGHFVVEEISSVVAGAYNALFYFSSKYVTLKTNNEEILKNFGFADSGLMIDVEKDISQTGVSFLPAVRDYGQEYDLIKIEDEKLYLGMRSNDMSSEDKRPTSLFYPLIRKAGVVDHDTHAGKCFAIINVKILDREKFMEYVHGHLPSIQKFGGRIIFESHDFTVYEGNNKPENLMVIQEWASKETFDQWWNSEDYKQWKEMRHEGAEVTLTLASSRF